MILLKKERRKEGRAVWQGKIFLSLFAGGIYNVVSYMRGMMDGDVLIVILCKMFL